MRKQTKKWTTRSGMKIRICDMTDQHLVNAIRCLRREAEKIRMRHVDEAAAAVDMVNGEMASYHAEQEFDEACMADAESYLPEIYWDLLMDAERRGLEI